MAVTVTKAGPYYASGEIKFSDLRRDFRANQRKQTSSGSETTNPSLNTGAISASELLRVTDTTVTNPIVPDATENSSIVSSESNWKVSLFRNSIKYYYIAQSGTDENFDIAAQSWNTNLDKNINKFMFIDGTCGSNNSSLPAAKLNATAHNLTVDTYGSILGASGIGGPAVITNVTKTTTFNHEFDNNPPWQLDKANNDLSVKSGDPMTIFANIDSNGGSRSYDINLTGLELNSTSYTVSVTNTDQTADGDSPGIELNAANSYGFNINLTFKNKANDAITFARDFTVTVNGTSGFSGGNGGDALEIISPNGSNIFVLTRNTARIYGGGGGGEKGNTGTNGSRGTCYSGGVSIPNNGGTGGVGGNGGSGRGYSNQLGSITGNPPSGGTQPSTCSGGGAGGATAGGPGETGANGGEWAQPGGNTTSNGSGGSAGRAIVGSNYLFGGVISSSTIKGSRVTV